MFSFKFANVLMRYDSTPPPPPQKNKEYKNTQLLKSQESLTSFVDVQSSSSKKLRTWWEYSCPAQVENLNGSLHLSSILYVCDPINCGHFQLHRRVLNVGSNLDSSHTFSNFKSGRLWFFSLGFHQHWSYKMQKLEVKVNIIFSLSDHVTYTLAIVPMIESRTWFIYIYISITISNLIVIYVFKLFVL